MKSMDLLRLHIFKYTSKQINKEYRMMNEPSDFSLIISVYPLLNYLIALVGVVLLVILVLKVVIFDQFLDF